MLSFMKINMAKKVINHFGDWTNYPYSNWLYQQGIKPGRNIDRDQDGIVDWEDCDPYDYNKQGIWSNVKSAASKVGGAIKSAASNISSKVSNTVQSISSKIAPQQTVTRTVSQQSYSTPTRSSSPTGSSGSSFSPAPTGSTNITNLNNTKSQAASVSRQVQTVYVYRPVVQPQEVVTQQLDQIRAMAGLDPNLVAGMSPAQLSQLKKNEMEQRRRAAMDRFHQLRKERKKVY